MRPGKKASKGTGSVGKRVMVVAIILFTLGVIAEQGYEWLRYQFRVPVTTESHWVDLNIVRGETRDQVASDLASKGLVRSPSAFLDYLRILQLKGTPLRLEAGNYTLNQNMSVEQIVNVLVAGKVAHIVVRMPDGITMKQMAVAAQNQGVGTAASYLQAASQLDKWQAKYDFLRGWPSSAPNNLEGFLYPDTYQLPPGANADDLVGSQLERFNQILTPTLRRKIAQSTSARPAQSIYTVIIMASLVDKEVSKQADRSTVCQVLYNRLGAHMPLGSDASVLYALGRTHGGLSEQDLKVDSPYNTRLHQGMPPGPISNPSQSALQACASPPDNNYLYFFSDTHGVTHFATNSQDFLRQQSQYGVAKTD